MAAGMTVLQKLHILEKVRCIYSINFRRAGVGITFYYPDKDNGDWHAALSTDQYYRTFEDAIEGEYAKLPQEDIDSADML